MYDKQQASEIRHQFWIALGKYMMPVPAAGNAKINRINYKTGLKEIQFKMDAQNKYAFFAVEIRGSIERRMQLYQIFLIYRKQFPDYFEWVEDCEDEQGKILSRIYCDKTNCTVFNKAHWPELITFFKENMIFIDEFWTEHKEIFEMAT